MNQCSFVIGGQYLKLKFSPEDIDSLKNILQFDRCSEPLEPYEVKVKLFAELEEEQNEPNFKELLEEKIQENREASSDSLVKLFDKIPPEIFRKNAYVSEAFKTSFSLSNESHIPNQRYCFSFNGKKIYRKRQIHTKKCSFALFNEFGLEGDFPFLSSSTLPSFIEVYTLTFLQKGCILKTIAVDSIIKIGLADTESDILPGFNFYIETESKVYLFGLKSARDALNWVKWIKASQNQLAKVKKLGIRIGFPHIDSLISFMNDFQPQKCIEACRKVLVFPPVRLNQLIDVQKLKNIFAELKKHLKLFHIQKLNLKMIQTFLLFFHSELAKSLGSARFDFDLKEAPIIYRIFENYYKLLSRYRIEDLNVKKLVISLNNLLFDKLIRSALLKIKNNLENFVINPSENLINDALDAILQSLELGPSNMKLSLRIVEQILEFFVLELKKLVVQDCRIGFIHFACILKITNKLSSSFFSFLKNNYEKKFDDKLFIMLQSSKLSYKFEKVFFFSYSRFLSKLENSIAEEFSRSSFQDLNLGILLDTEVYSQSFSLKNIVPKGIFDLIANHIVRKTIKTYFDSLLLAIAKSDHNLKLNTRISTDRQLFANRFKKMIDDDNLEYFLLPFKLIGDLLKSTNFDRCVTLILKFNVFYENKLTTEIIASLLENNIMIPLPVEQDILDFFNNCVLTNKQKFPRNASGFQNFNFLLPFWMICKFSSLVFEARKNCFFEEKKASMDLSDNGDLVNFAACETNLENMVKVLVVQGDDISQETYVNLVKARSYDKLLLKITQNVMSFINIENSKVVWKSEIIFFSNISMMNDLVLKFSVTNRLFVIIFPTKIERNLWFFSLRNMRKELNHFETENLSPINTNVFKIDYDFSHNSFIDCKIRIKKEPLHAIESMKVLNLLELSTMIRENVYERERQIMRNPISSKFFEQFDIDEPQPNIIEQKNLQHELSYSEKIPEEKSDYINLDQKCFESLINSQLNDDYDDINKNISQIVSSSSEREKELIKESLPGPPSVTENGIVLSDDETPSSNNQNQNSENANQVADNSISSSSL